VAGSQLVAFARQLTALGRLAQQLAAVGEPAQQLAQRQLAHWLGPALSLD
jgi:hypothetical protein